MDQGQLSSSGLPGTLPVEGGGGAWVQGSKNPPTPCNSLLPGEPQGGRGRAPLDAGLACRGSSASPKVGVSERRGGSGKRQAAIGPREGWGLGPPWEPYCGELIERSLCFCSRPAKALSITRFNLHLTSPLFGNMYLRV